MNLQGQLTNISGLMGLFIIFLMAFYSSSNYSWIAGIAALLIILSIRNLIGEVSRKADLLAAVLSWICVLLTFLLIVEK